MIYQIDNGTILEGETPEQLVASWHSVSLAQAADDWAWMEETSKRVYQQTGHTVRWGSASDFIADMTTAGLIKEIGDDEEGKEELSA